MVLAGHALQTVRLNMSLMVQLVSHSRLCKMPQVLDCPRISVPSVGSYQAARYRGPNGQQVDAPALLHFWDRTPTFPAFLHRRRGRNQITGLANFNSKVWKLQVGDDSGSCPRSASPWPSSFPRSHLQNKPCLCRVNSHVLSPSQCEREY